MQYKHKLFFLLPCLWIETAAFGRFAKMEEASYKKRSAIKVRVYKNFTYTTEETHCRELMDSSEKARSQGSLSISYSPVVEKILEFRAWVEFGPKKIPVSKENIEIKDASASQGFDETKVYQIAYPEVKKGANLCFQIKTKNQPIVAESFSLNEALAQPYEAFQLTLDSEIPLYFEKVGDHSLLETVTSKPNPKLIRFETKLKKPFNFDLVEEPEGDGPAPALPRIIFTSAESHETFYKNLLPAYRARLGEKLPEAFNKTIQEAQKEPDLYKKIELVMAQVNDVIRYHGDWRTTENKHVPRPFAKVMQTKYGDCKDFAALTSVILQRLGIHASVAFVYRGPYFPFDYRLPFLSEFNHAIVHITTDTNEDMWVDPTNTVMFARAPREDISGRRSLILDHITGTLSLKQIPLNEPKDAKRDSQIFYDMSDKKTLTKDIQVTYEGLWGVWLATTFYQKPLSKIEFAFLNTFTEGKKPTRSKLEKIEKIDSRLPQSLAVSMQVTIPYRYFETPLGKGIILEPPEDIETLSTVSVEGYEHGILLQAPTQIRKDVHYLGVSALGDLTQLSCSGSSKWIDYERWIEQNSQGVNVSNSYTVKRPYLTKDDLLSKEFGELQNKLSDCFENKMMILKF